ncbi:oxidation resistance protein 1-like isoform X1 [Styela clava]
MLSSKMQRSDMNTSGHGHQHSAGFGATTKPSGTTEYVTSSRDTLRSIAVAFDTTTTRLMKLNRMSSLTVFPGQTLFVPSNDSDTHSPSPPADCDETSTTPPKSDSTWDSFTGDFSFLSPLSPSTSALRPFKDLVMVSSKVDTTNSTDANKNEVDNYKKSNGSDKRKAFKANKRDGAIEREDLTRSLSHNSTSADRQRVMSGESVESEPFEEGFLKMKVHYITHTKEMVQGVMLVTPTALMFDPEPDDPVALRDGCTEYGIMCPMHLINTIAMYNDTSRMTPSSTMSPLVEPSTETETKEIRSDSHSSMSSDTTTEAEAEISDAIEDDDLPDIPLEVENQASCTNSKPKSTWSPVHESTLYEVKGPVPGSAKVAYSSKSENKIETSNSDIINSEDNNTSNFFTTNEAQHNTKDEFKLENEFPFLHAVVKTVGEYLPSLEDSNKKSTSRPNSNHMFLCIRARRPMMKTFSISEDDELSTLSCVDKTEDNRLPEYWFQVPRKRSDHLYAFFLQWSPENNPDDAALQLGFIIMEDEPYVEDTTDANDNKKRIRSFTNSSLDFVEDFFDESYSFEKEWEIISIQEAKRRSVSTNAIELAEADDSLVPELEKPSNLLDDAMLLSLCKSLPNRCVGYSWSPVYTTYDHGTSLRTLYRNLSNFDAPVVLVVQDSNDHIFGALCSNSLHVSDHYYGTGESFLFKASPQFEVYKWTGDNSFFIKGNTDSFTIGGGKGTFGLWLDSDLYRGCSHPCDTFKNKVLSSEEDFIIQTVEVWMIKDI